MSLSHTKVFLFRCEYRIFQRIQLQAEQMAPDRPVCEPLHEHRNQRVFVNWVGSYTTRKESYMLGVSVNITLTLLESQDLSSSPELSPWRLKHLSEPGLELI